jgi:hypothetical protein
VFFEGVKPQSTAFCTAFLNVEYNTLSILFKRGGESVSCLLPIDLKKLARKIAPSMNPPKNETELPAFIGEVKGNDYPKSQALWDEFFDHLCALVQEKAQKYFGETREFIFAVGGHCDALYGIARRLQKTEKVFPYHLFFRRQISPIIDSEIVLVLENFIPALLSTAALDGKTLDRLADLQTDGAKVKREKQSHFSYEKCVTGLLCAASILFYFSQKLNFQCIQEEYRTGKILAQRAEILPIAERIDSLSKRIEKQKKSLENALVYVEQQRAWCTLLNGLQELLSQMGAVYLNSFTWLVQTAKEKKTLPMEKSKKIRQGNGDSIQLTKNQENRNLSVLSSSIHVAGVLFVGNAEIGGEVREDFNDQFNGLFAAMGCLPFCVKVSHIRINLPENGRIAFRCVIELDPQSKIIAP